MTVEISGPKGYDYQYLITLLVALEYLDKDDVEVYVEKENEEDAQVTFYEEGEKYSVDIQVKRRTNEIDIINFADWLCHFENRSADVSLLNKIKIDKKRFAIIVSNSRCSDDVSLFVDEGIIHCELSKAVGNDLLYKIKEAMYLCYSDNKELSILRRNFLKEFLESIKNNDLRNILKRIKLRDRYTEEYAIEKIRFLLNRKYYIPQSMMDRAIIELVDKIRNGRDSRDTISTDLIKVIDKYSGKNIFNMDDKYVTRCERELCRNVLSAENILLLTGVSFCGKTYLSKDIAQEYVNKGYKVEITGEIYGENGAVSFIRHGGIEDRLLILEDPFGQVETKKDAISILSEVRNLTIEAKENRKLIITSRKDILLDIMSKKFINECSINSNNWIDLTLQGSDEMLTLWKNYFGDSEESKKLFDDISKWLLKNEKTCSIQLGHIANIFNNKKSLHKLLELEPAEIVNIARIDSNDLSRIIENRGNSASKVFIALGLSCNTYKSVNIDDLAFILSDCSEQPSIHEDNDYIIEYSFQKVPEESFPKYDSSIKINDKFKSELRYLKQHGYIEIDNLKRVIFTHPIYHYATQILFKKYFFDIFEQDDVINIVKQSLSSLSINANLCTLTTLENTYIENPDDVLKSIMLRSLNSIFTSVRDRVVMFFDRRINDLSEREQEKFVRELKYGDSIKNGGILWYDGLPWINPSKKRELSYRDWFHDKITKDNVILLLRKIDDGIVLSSEEMWDLLNVRYDKVISFKVLEKALSYDESFIREKAIRLIFKYYAFKFNKLDNYLYIYEHPDIIYGLFRGALDSWSKYNNEFKRLILEYYKNSLDIMSVAIKSKKFLENFEDEHSSESIEWSEVREEDKIELWNVWHEVFVEFLNKFPSRYIEMDEGHMVLVTENSLEHVNSVEKVVELATAWFNWLDRYLQYNMPQDYGMSVAEYLIDGTQYNSNDRKDIFKMMLLTDKTSFITTNIKVFIDSWKYLSDYEKNLVLDLLNSNRNDVEWIRAVALNRRNIPNEIQVVVLGQSIEEKNVADIVNILIEKNMLEQCLNVHCGYPQPLWWNGYHHINNKLWDAVIVEVLKRNDLNRAFNIALREIVDLLYNDDNRRIFNIYDIYMYYLLKEEEKRKLVFKRLLQETVSQNQCNKKAWDLLFEYSTDKEKEYYYDRIAEDIELIEYWQIGYGDLFALFDESIVYNKICPRLEIDKQVMNFSDMILRLYKLLEESENKYESYHSNEPRVSIENLDNEKNSYINLDLQQLRTKFNDTVIKIYNVNPPRLILTNKLVSYVNKKIGLNSTELEKVVEKNRRRLIDSTRELRKKYNDHYDIENWIE
ncbi:hypothetical protein NRP93_003531 [Clostridium botulinum]|nr:hypothetical protein [Clostridium botulinum]